MFLSIIDFFIAPFILMVILFISKNIRDKNIKTNPSYKYYIPGILVKLAGGIGVCLIYIFYYNGGDTMNYFHDASCFINLFFKNPSAFFHVMHGEFTLEKLFMFDDRTDYPYYYYDQTGMFVVRLMVPFIMIACRSFLGATMLLAWVSYFAIWRMYQLFLKQFPTLGKEFAISIFFIPSVFFWGSGMLKDTITFACVALYTASFYDLLIKRTSIPKNIITLFIAVYFLAAIKPYILFALLPGSILWLAGITLTNVNNKLVRNATAPLLIFLSVIIGYIVLSLMGNYLGSYALETVLVRAVTVQQDLQREFYGGTTFNIGEFDPTVSGVLGKAPVAIMAALFRPYLWEARNPVMMISGLENGVLLGFTIYLIIKLKVYNVFRLMMKHHLLVFCLLFSLFFAFSIGLTTSNFGSMVRYKIPAIPFYAASLFIIRYTYQELVLKEKEKYYIAPSFK